MHICHADRYAGYGCIVEPELLEVVEENNGRTFAALFVGKFYDLGKFLLGHVLIDHRKRYFRGNYLIEDNPSCGRLEELTVHADLNSGMLAQLSGIIGNPDILGASKAFPLVDCGVPLV